MGKYDNYSVEDCNKCLAELNESLDKLTKQFEAKEIKRFQYNFNKKANAKQVNEVKARLAELTEAFVTTKDNKRYSVAKALNVYNNIYDILYEHEDELEQIFPFGISVYFDLGEKLIKENNSFVEKLIAERKDLFMSDREITALGMLYSGTTNQELTSLLIDNADVKTESKLYVDQKEDLGNGKYHVKLKQDNHEQWFNINGKKDNGALDYDYDHEAEQADEDRDYFDSSVDVNDVEEILLQAIKEPVEEKLFGASDEVIADSKAKGLYTENKVSDLLDELDSLNFKNDDEEDEFLEFTGISRAQLEGSQGFDELDAEIFLSKISDWQNKSVITEDVNSDETYVYEYYDTEEDAEATVHFFNEQGRKAEVKPEGEKYAVVLSADYFDDSKNIIESVWSSVCSNDIPFVKHAYSNKLITPNTRYTRFHDDNSFIMGALRNENFEMAELLKSFGEKILKAELSEYKRIMAEREYEDETTRTAMEESKPLNEKVYRYAIDKNSNIVDGMGGDSYFSNEQEAIDVAKELDADTVIKYTFASETDADSRELCEDAEEIWVSDRIKADREALAKELNEDYEEMEDVDYEDEETISLLDIALKEVPKIGVEDWGQEDELYFVGDTIALFEALKDDEVKIPKHYYENADAYDWSNGIEDYLTDIGVNIEEGKGNNTYNWSASITHPVNFTEYSYGDELYVSFAIHREGDVRGNYTTEFLMKFADNYDFLEALDDACRENCWRELKYNDKTYYITPQFWSDCVSITCPDTGEYWDDVHCGNLSDFEEVIKQPTDEYKDTVTESAVTPEIQKHLDKLESDLLAIPNVTKVEFDTAGYLDGINAPITLVSYEIETQGEQYFNDLAELKSKVFATLEDNGVNVEKGEFEDNDTYFYIVAYSTNWDNKLTEAPTPEDAEYKKLCDEIEFQAEENDFTLTEEDVKAIADKMVADKFFFNHDINVDDNNEQAWEEINSLIISAIEAHPNKIEESANDKVINAVRQGLSKHDVDNLSVDEDEEGNISVMYHSDKDSFPIVQNICKVVDIDKATLIPELDKLDVGKTFLTEDWEELEDNN